MTPERREPLPRFMIHMLHVRAFCALATALRGCTPSRLRWRAMRHLGWTFIELMLVVAIIGTLASMAVPKLRQYTDKAKVARAVGDIEVIQADLAGHELLGMGLPPTLADIGWGDLLDPWSNPYQYMPFETVTEEGEREVVTENLAAEPREDEFLEPLNTSYDLYSMGKDGRSEPELDEEVSHDDVLRANDGQYIGLASKY